METKANLRKLYKQKRSELPETQREQAAVQVANSLKALLDKKWQRVHVYLPIERLFELDTEPIIGLLWGLDKEIAISSSDFESHQMTHYILTEETLLRPNEWGIPEPVGAEAIDPSTIDAVIIPLLVADENGNRLGYGKGFYDRFLAHCPNAIRIGIGYFDLVPNLPEVNEHDVPLDYYVSPGKTTAFS